MDRASKTAPTGGTLRSNRVPQNPPGGHPTPRGCTQSGKGTHKHLNVVLSNCACAASRFKAGVTENPFGLRRVAEGVPVLDVLAAVAGGPMTFDQLLAGLPAGGLADVDA